MYATTGSRELSLGRRRDGAIARHRLSIVVLAAGLCSLVVQGAWAQQSPAAPASPSAAALGAAPTPPSAPRETPRPDQLEPGVATSSAASPTPNAATSAAPNAATSAGPNATTSAVPNAAPASAAGRRKSSQAKADPAQTADGPAPKSGARGGKAQDRLELDTTQITGNRELPKVLYIVPWKRSDLGDLVGKPVNSLLDEVLEPVDRDVFKRENRYYDALKPDQTKQGTVTVEGAGDKR